MDPLLLQSFLILNIFIIGVLVTIAIRHAISHFKPRAEEVEKPHHQQHVAAQSVHLPPAVKERLLQASQAHFQAVLNRSALELQHDLKTTTFHLNKQLAKLGGEIISDEMKRYHTSLDELRKQAENSIFSAQTDISVHQAEIKAKLVERQADMETKMTAEIDEQKKIMLQNIDTKLADAVASFLTETLQHNVDLGAQTEYLMAILEENKAELVKGIVDEA